jgi:hypothetical protein
MKKRKLLLHFRFFMPDLYQKKGTALAQYIINLTIVTKTPILSGVNVELCRTEVLGRGAEGLSI